MSTSLAEWAAALAELIESAEQFGRRLHQLGGIPTDGDRDERLQILNGLWRRLAVERPTLPACSKRAHLMTARCHQAAESAQHILHHLLEDVLAEQARLLAAGASDPARPVLHASDFGTTGFFVVPTDPAPRPLYGSRDALPANHAARTLLADDEFYHLSPPGKVFVLGIEGQQIFDLALVLELTKDWRRGQLATQADRRRDEARQDREAQERREQSSEYKLARLEEQVRQLTAALAEQRQAQAEANGHAH